MYPKDRINALTDGVFAVAMTLLILDVRLPEEFHPQSATELLSALGHLWQKLFVYALSFYVLGSSWLGSIKIRDAHEQVGKSFALWWLLYLLLATGIPFTTTVLGRFVVWAPAIWLYAANLGLLAAVGYRATLLQVGGRDDELIHDKKVSLLVLIATTMLAIAISFFHPVLSPWAFWLNAFASRLASWHFRSRKQAGV